jgi:AcrR family transcriptional regulator
VAQPTLARQTAEEALLDAAERLLVAGGHAGITTRRLAAEAGVNHGLVHYYFGSVEHLLVRVNDEWRAVLTEALAGPREEYGLELPLEALVALVMTFNEGIMLERLSGVSAGHRELLDWIDGWLSR